MNRTFLPVGRGRLPHRGRSAAQAPTQQPAAARSPSQQPSEVRTTISSGEAGAPPRFAVPDFIALSNDAETVDAAKTIARVLLGRSELRARVRAHSPRHLRHDPAGHVDLRRAVRSLARAERRRRHHRHRREDGRRRACRGAAVQRAQPSVGVRAASTAARSRTSGCTRTRSADEMHQQQRALRGVARTKLTFNSDRSGERMSGTRREPQRQRGVHLGLRRREPAPGDDQPIAEHQFGVVARRTVAWRTPRIAGARRISSSRTSTRAPAGS